MTSTYEWPRAAGLEQWLAQHGWEVDPTVFMSGVLGRAVQVRRVNAAWQDGETGLLILPGETVECDGERMKIASRRAATGTAR